MELKPGERLIAEEDIGQEAIDELTPVKEQLKEIETEAKRLSEQIAVLRGQMDVQKSKAQYLSKLKWSIFDRYHPKTNQAKFTPGPDMSARRSYDWATKKVCLVEYPLEGGGSLPGFLVEILSEALDERLNKPKRPAPPATATPESAETKQSTASAETAEAATP